MDTAHENTGQHAGTLDGDLAEFLDNYVKEYEKTHELVIFLHADHGMRYGSWHKDSAAF